MEINHGASLLAMLDNMIEKKARLLDAYEWFRRPADNVKRDLEELRRQRAYYELKYNDPTLQ